MKIAIHIDEALLEPFAEARKQLLAEISYAPPVSDLIEIHLAGVDIEQLLSTVYVTALQQRRELKLPEFNDPHAPPSDPQERIPLPPIPGLE